MNEAKRNECVSRPSGSAGIISQIVAEVERAMRKFPTWPTDPIHAAAVVAEECGELQKSVLEAVYEPHKGSRPNIRIEAIQTAAMCIRFLESLDEYEWYRAKQHSQQGVSSQKQCSEGYKYIGVPVDEFLSQNTKLTAPKDAVE